MKLVILILFISSFSINAAFIQSLTFSSNLFSGVFSNSQQVSTTIQSSSRQSQLKSAKQGRGVDDMQAFEMRSILPCNTLNALGANDECSLVVQVGKTLLNCSSRNLTEVPKGRNYSTVTELDLKDNQITILNNNSFINFPILTRLVISDNTLSTLEVNCFHGLDKLQHLNLRNNQLMLKNQTFHPYVFSPLVSLETLFINKNVPQEAIGTVGSYPGEALSKLGSLVELHMDGLPNVKLSTYFLRMTSLTRLTLAGYSQGNCKMVGLSNDMFVNVPNLTYLDISSCYITGKNIELRAFTPLRRLEVLNLTHNEDIDIAHLDTVFRSLYNITSLRELRMRLIVNRYSLGICLDASYVENFPRHLETFDAQENNLEACDRQVISKLSPSLKVLNLSGNKFVFGTYLQDLKYMENLTELYLNGGSFTYSLPVAFPFELSTTLTNSSCTLYGLSSIANKGPFYLELPPNLSKLEMNGAGLTYRLTNLTIKKNNLTSLYLQNNNFPSLEGPIYGLEKLHVLDLYCSSVNFINLTFFNTFASLQSLNLSNNLLGDFFSSANPSTLVFYNLTKLEKLDLSSNGIRVLHLDMFVNLTSLTNLNLANNILSEFNFDISTMLSLQFLDISKTRISKIPPDTLAFIDRLSNITINMEKCDISCECDNFVFLTWMVNSKAFNKSFTNYQCVYLDASLKPINDGYNSTLEILTRKCTSHVAMFLMAGSGTVFLFFLLLTAIVYRFRWKIRYLYYAAYLYYKKSGGKSNTNFKYDAFISYDHADEETIVVKICHELERRGLKLCVHGRDFNAGDYIASNVVRAVCSSRKTLIVLTRNMLSSYWCKYELQMANMESVHTGRQVLIFLLVEDIPHNELGVELLYNIRNNTYMSYPPESSDRSQWNLLWSKLANDIRD